MLRFKIPRFHSPFREPAGNPQCPDPSHSSIPEPQKHRKTPKFTEIRQRSPDVPKNAQIASSEISPGIDSSSMDLLPIHSL
jgi:hypothetical protein